MTISGAKNAAVAILPATLIVNSLCVIDNVPNIYDVNIVLDILKELGARVEWIGRNSVSIDTRTVDKYNIDHEKARSMRGSYYFLGALLSRFRKASIALPGGCNLGPRPIDQHLKVFTMLGCEVGAEYGSVSVSAQKLTGAHYFLDICVGWRNDQRHAVAVTAEGTGETLPGRE